jgi:glutamate dehydrogenase
LSEEVRQMLGFPVLQEVATAKEIVDAILAMQADLFWLGGSGPVLRAAAEMGLPADMSALPGMPVAAADVRAQVVVEPRPEAVTQRARIELAQRGGRINTAAIDGAAGVDLSDHEVNFKLAVGAAVEGGHLLAHQRVQLIDEVKPQALAAVLARSLAHARAITLDQRRSQTQIDDFRQLAGQLIADGLAAPGTLLSDLELSIGRRGPLGGLSRPELADLLALSKRSLQRRILASDVPDDGFLEGYLRAYFPEGLTARCGQQVRSHKLRREIIAAELARLIVESMGVTFVGRVCRETGAEVAAVIRAWAVVVETSGALDLWDEVGNAEPPLPLRGELACWEALARAIESATRWVLQTQPPEATAGGVFEMYAEPARDLLKALPRVLPASQLARIHERVGALAREGVPRALPERIVPLDCLADVLDIVDIAAEYGLEREMVTELYYEISDLLDLDWVRDRIAELPADTRWERRARNSLTEGLLYVRKELTRRILMSQQESMPTQSALEEYLVEHQEQLTHLGELIDDITSAQRPSLAALMVIVREYGHLVERYA